MRVGVLIVLLTAFAAAAAAPAALALSRAERISYRVSSDYTKDGEIDPCKYTTAELQTALKNVSPDLRQYASDYPEAIKAAIEQRASGACDEPAPSTGSVPPAATTAPSSLPPAFPTAAATPGATATVAEPPAPDTARLPEPVADDSEALLQRAAAATPDNSAPAPLIGLGLLAVLLALTAALMLTLRRFGAGEGRLAPAYHSWREARWRAGGVWADFRDWLSLGR